MHKKLAFAVVMAAVVLLQGDAVALDPGACCVFSTSKLDAMMNPVRGGDEKFFTAAGGPPTVLFILDTGGQMNTWPTDWPTTPDGGYGCMSANFGLSNNPATVADGGTGTDWSDFTRATGGYISSWDGGNGDPSSTGYGQLWTGLSAIETKWFNDNFVWSADDAGFGTDFNGGGSGPVSVTAGYPVNAGVDRAANITTACATVPAARIATCTQCLANDGYYIDSTANRLVTGHFLNYYGPRDSSMVKVMSDILHDIANVRFGMVVLHANVGDCAHGGSKSMCVQEDFKPPCSQWPDADATGQKNSILGNFTAKLMWGGESPLGDLLYAGAHFYRGRSVTDQFNVMFPGGFPSDNKLDEKNGMNRSICASCGLNTAILVTGSMPGDDEAAGQPAAALGQLPVEIRVPKLTTPGYYGPNTYLADVAEYFYKDADLVNNTASVIAGDTMVGRQKMSTYTVAFTSNRQVNALLQRAARAGGGVRYQATNAPKLKQAIYDALNDILTRNTAFSSAAVPSLQTGSQQVNAVVPRMRPQAGSAWQGEIWRFRLANEFVLDRDFNNDGDKSDTFMVEKFGGDAAAFADAVSATPTGAWAQIGSHLVMEDPNGDFVVANVVSGVLTATSTAATPAWEANNKISTAGFAARQVYTVVDDKTLDPASPENAGTAGGDGAFTHHDTRIQFTAANYAQVIEYLGITGTSFCPNLATSELGDFYTKLEVDNFEVASALGVAVPLTQDDSDVLCAKALINWTLGQDLADTNGDGLRTDTREMVLGDIFHSSPVVVEPPLIDAFLCELGLSNQCVQTLYQQYLPTTPTPLTSYGTELGRCGGPNVARTAYEKYAMDARMRPKLVLVGANDGMLHAFHAGTAIEDCSVTPVTLEHDPGNGTEVWAFIPPDVLPRLREVPFGHTYLMDGDIMVRDIWAESSTNPNQKDADEYRTLAIASEGRGGNHYIALEVPFDNSTSPPTPLPPNFRWMYPQPCSLESITFGKTFYSLSPKPPPIGPVLMKADTSVVKPNRGNGFVRASVNPASASGDRSNEVWVAMLSGGWSPMHERGRGIYMVDAWFGAINDRRDNLWWKWEFNDSASGEQQGPREHLTHSIAAPVAMVDYGNQTRVGLDGFFDSAVVGDTFGQLWVLRFSLRGTLDTATKRIDNWAGGRGFMIDKASTVADSDSDVDGSDDINRWPFYYLPSIAIQPGTNAMRAYIGSGDRVHLLDRRAGECRYDNPLACSKYNCDEVATYYKTRKMDYTDLGTYGQHTHWEDEQEYNHGRVDMTTGLGRTYCDNVDVRHDDYEIDDCDGIDPDDVNSVRVTCGRITPDGGYNCGPVTVMSGTRQLNDLITTPSNGTLDGLGRNRYFGVWVYGGNRGIFDESETSGAGNRTARDFDNARISDRTGANAVSGDLVDVTGAFCNQVGGCVNYGGAAIAGNADNGMGWMYEYRDSYTASNSFTRASLEHKTASGSSILGGCVLYSSLYPIQGTSCSQVAQARSRLHQGDYISGLPNCADSFKGADGGWERYQDRDVLAPPPELSATVQISSSGKIKYSSLVLEPSKSQATEIAVQVGSDILQSVYEVSLSQPQHNCRHGDAGCAAMSP